MAIVIKETVCIGCSLCVIECPEEAISARGVAIIDRNKCIECLECIDYCHADAIEEV